LFSSIIGREGSGVSHKYNSVSYTSSQMSESEEAEWKTERFQMAIKHYKGIIEKISDIDSDKKDIIRTELAQALFDTENFDEAVQIYEDAFNVGIFISNICFRKIFLF
jgi:tetratricopeptide (TPR) repeat protein